MIFHQLSIYTSMKHSLLFHKLLALALHSLDTLSGVRIKAFLFSFNYLVVIIVYIVFESSVINLI
jgi:hypothetical protein